MISLQQSLPKSAFALFALVFLPTLAWEQNDPKVIRTIAYNEILNARMTPYAKIERMKMSANGGMVVFNTVGGELYTINTNGTPLTKILAQDARGFLDISADGAFIIFARLYGYEIKVFSSTGVPGASVANKLPLPQGGTTGPDIRLNPVIADSTGASGLEARIFFTAVAGGPDVAGVWSVKPDGLELKQHFSYRQMAKLFNKDGSEFNGNVAFQQGFAVSENGRRIVVGTWNFQAEGHTILWDEFTGLKILRNYGPARSDVPSGLTISPNGNTIVMTKGVPGTLNFPLECIDFTSGQSSDLIHNAGTSPSVQMTAGGEKVLGGGDSIPLTLFNTDGSARLELVNSPELNGRGDSFYRNSIGPTISISANGNRFAFVSGLEYNDYSRLWVADIYEGAVPSLPVISNIKLSPNYVVVNGSTFAQFTADISGGSNPILGAGFSGFNNGIFERILGDANYYWFWDDGRHGDLVAGDGNYGAESVRTQMTENPNPGHRYMIRFSACTEHRVTVVDVEPFYIRNTPVGLEEQRQPASPAFYKLEQNYPNPFNPSTRIKYQLARSGHVVLMIYNLAGQEIATVVNEFQSAGEHEVTWQPKGLPSGLYFYRVHTGDFSEAKKLILQK